jgi:hypothetical protein
MLRFLIALVLFGHGIGHSLGLLQTFRVATVNPAWNGDSWLLTGLAGTTVSQAIGVALWSIALVGFVASAGIVMGWLPVGWWVPVAIGSSIASLLAVALFPAAFPLTSTVGAAIVDVVVLAAVLGMHWLPTDLPA